VGGLLGFGMGYNFHCFPDGREVAKFKNRIEKEGEVNESMGG
jgi:hypothetical protein